MKSANLDYMLRNPERKIADVTTSKGEVHSLSTGVPILETICGELESISAKIDKIQYDSWSLRGNISELKKEVARLRKAAFPKPTVKKVAKK